MDGCRAVAAGESPSEATCPGMEVGIELAHCSGMHKGIYIALSGAVLKQDHLDVITHNIANAHTVGFKRGRVAFRDFLVSRMSGYPGSDEGRAMSDLGAKGTDFSAGNMLKTGNPLDVAIDGKGFIALEGNRYTRKGDMRIDSEGNLVTQAGIKVLGEGGPIRLPAGKVDIAPSGEVRVENVPVGTIRLVDFADAASLKEVDNGHFTSQAIPDKAEAQVLQGHLESGNVNMFREMVFLVETMREFETFQKAIHAFDEAASKINNELARI